MFRPGLRALFLAAARAAVLAGVIGALAACTSPALDYARAQHPGCSVREIDTTDGRATVEIACPGSEPYRRSYAPR